MIVLADPVSTLIKNESKHLVIELQHSLQNLIMKLGWGYTSFIIKWRKWSPKQKLQWIRGETSRKFQISARAEPKVSRAEPSHEPEILNFFRAEPSPSQYLVEPSRALIFSSRARAEPRAILLSKFSEIFQHSSEAQLHSSCMVI